MLKELLTKELSEFGIQVKAKYIKENRWDIICVALEKLEEISGTNLPPKIAPVFDKLGVSFSSGRIPVDFSTMKMPKFTEYVGFNFNNDLDIFYVTFINEERDLI